MRMTTYTKLAATVMAVLTIVTLAREEERTLDRLAIFVSPKMLKSATQPNASGTLNLKAIDSNGARSTFYRFLMS